VKSPITCAALALAACATATTNRTTLDGTSWRVAAINGQATPAAGNYTMQFAGGELSARFGCNSIGGTYFVANETLTTSNLHSTLMGCLEPSATFERQGLAVANRPMRTSWTGKTRLVLGNSAGLITLERLP
jgi:heat shock protein HslJ